MTAMPLPGTPKVTAFAARQGLVFVKTDPWPCTGNTAAITVYELAQFRQLIAEMTAVADDCESQLGLPLHELPTGSENAP